jgi:hypothetical protein
LDILCCAKLVFFGRLQPRKGKFSAIFENVFEKLISDLRTQHLILNKSTTLMSFILFLKNFGQQKLKKNA